MRVADKRSLSVKHGASPNTDDSLKTLEIVFSAVGGKKCLPVCQKEKDVVRKEGGGGRGGRVVFTGFSESDINSRMRKSLILKLTL